ncbi:MAG: YidC/Oxa1 family membrane protein insertase [Candidatus Paceibacterota bacterium]
MFIVDTFNFIIYEPLYNGLVFVMWLLPWSDAGLAVIIFTVIVRLLLFPLSRKAVQTQMKMRAHEDELKQIKEDNKDDRQAQAQKMMAFYKEKGINPFSSFLLILIQLPIIIALYHIFLNAGLPDIDRSLLYFFVHAPETITVELFGLSFLSISGKSLVLAVTASVTSFFQIRYSLPPLKPKTGDKPNLKEDLARSMNMQMRYVFPVIVFFIAWSISGAIALYWTTSNLFTLGQELVVRREMRRKTAAEVAQKESESESEKEAAGVSTSEPAGDPTDDSADEPAAAPDTTNASKTSGDPSPAEAAPALNTRKKKKRRRKKNR